LTADARAAIQAALRTGLQDAALSVRALHPLGGGTFGSTARVETSAGAFFAKYGEGLPDGLFAREADGLAALAGAGTPLAVPRVVAVGPALLVTELLEPAPLDQAALGRGLAELHRRTSDAFGFHVDTYCGATLQANAPLASWPRFYGERRLRPLLDTIAARRGLPASERGVYERVIERLPSLVAAGAAPALIHGDLWSGNALGSTRGPALVDPACAYADREAELGMMTLFGGFDARCFDAYEEAFPLPAGWRERNGLYQLYHLLNHHALFGGHYGASALGLARRYA
jgi:protein-ribulosamine 3-kinase